MIFSCKCLNMVVKAPRERLETCSETPDIGKLLQDVGSGSDSPFAANFFKQAMGPIDEINAITKSQGALVQVIAVEDWQLQRCLNCKVIVFAINEIHRTYLMNRSCRTTLEEIEKVRSGAVYSPIFNIAMVASDLNSGSNDLRSGGNGDKSRIKALEWSMHQAMLAETATVEERIRVYSEQQFALLKMQRLRAEQEFHTLCNVIHSVPEIAGSGGNQSPSGATSEPPSKASLMETPPATPDNTPMSIGNSPPLGVAAQATMSLFKQQKIPNSGNVKSLSFKSTSVLKSSKHSATNHGIEGSLDSDGIFDLDGMVDGFPVTAAVNKSPMSSNMSDLEESDHEDAPEKPSARGTGMQIPRQYNRQSTIAKSLPISMPVAAIQPFRTTEEDFEEMPEDSNVDIAASIKALARSVHGEAIFGDLPRPRRPKFITDI